MMTRELAAANFSAQPLGAVVEFLDSRRRPVKQSDRKPGPYPYYGANGQQGTIDDYLFDEPLILLAEDGGFFDAPERGIAYQIEGKTWVNNHAHVLRPKSEILDLAYLRRVLENYDVRPFINGSTRSKLTKTQASNILIPLPSLGEQRRVAAILDRADTLRRKRKHAIDLLDGLTQSIFRSKFSHELGRRGWRRATLFEVTDCLDSRRKPVRESERPEGKVPYYGANGQQGWIDKALFDEPLVLVAEDGGHFTKPERGVAYRIDGPAWVNNHAHILRPRPEHLTISYLHHALRHYDFTPYISGTTRSKLTQSQLKKAEIVVPPIKLQREFEFETMSAAGLRHCAQTNKIQLDALFLSLRSRAFSGRL